MSEPSSTPAAAGLTVAVTVQLAGGAEYAPPVVTTQRTQAPPCSCGCGENNGAGGGHY